MYGHLYEYVDGDCGVIRIDIYRDCTYGYCVEIVRTLV